MRVIHQVLSALSSATSSLSVCYSDQTTCNALYHVHQHAKVKNLGMVHSWSFAVQGVAMHKGSGLEQSCTYGRHDKPAAMSPTWSPVSPLVECHDCSWSHRHGFPHCRCQRKGMQHRKLPLAAAVAGTELRHGACDNKASRRPTDQDGGELGVACIRVLVGTDLSLSYRNTSILNQHTSNSLYGMCALLPLTGNTLVKRCVDTRKPCSCLRGPLASKRCLQTHLNLVHRELSRLTANVL